ncbi:hypothetical protein LA938_000331 [Salmonella enterica subsp. enterica serovar Mikawasima]|nr:hypothetical protein [Salmonella enterica subsp. enterica serovar Mikawasima]EID1816845.1 hypothetical protein [Salmonella enterica subsp. enterica serovar Mikawasima]
MWVKWIKRLPWPGIILALVIILGFAGTWLRGYTSGHADARRDGDKALAQLQSQFDAYRLRSAEQQNETLMAIMGRYNDQVAAAHQADADFQAKKQQLERENADLKKQIADVTRQWVDEKGKHHPIKCVFTRGFVQQYNAAIGASDGDSGMSAATGSASAGKSTGTTDTALARLRDSGVSQADVLANVTDNARQCRVWREQVNGLLDYTEGLHQ